MKTKFRMFPRSLFLASIVVAAAQWTTLATTSVARADDTETPAKSDAETKPKEDGDTKKKTIVAIVGGDIHTVSREVVRSGTVIIEDGKIKEVGQKVTVPDGAKVIDAKGMHVVPGFVAVDMSGVGVGSVGGNNQIGDVLNPFDRNIKLSLAVGITTGCTQVGGGGAGRGRRRAPEDNFLGLEPELDQLLTDVGQAELDYGVAESLCPCCGLPILPADPITDPQPRDITASGNVVIKMSFGTLDGMVLGENVFYDVPRGSLTGALNHHTWRKQIAAARKYLEDVAAHEKATREGKKENPPRKNVSDTLLALVQGKSRLRTPAASASEIREMVQLADELDYKLALTDVVEAWLVADLLAEHDVMVTFAPRNRRQARLGEEETSGSWVEQPRVLRDASVPFALTTLSNSISLNGLAGRDLTSLPLEGAFAVRGGCDESEALASLTMVPAKMLGLDAKIGSIESGKDADILIMNGTPLDYQTYVETALVDGRVVYERATDRVLPVFERK